MPQNDINDSIIIDSSLVVATQRSNIDTVSVDSVTTDRVTVTETKKVKNEIKHQKAESVPIEKKKNVGKRVSVENPYKITNTSDFTFHSKADLKGLDTTPTQLNQFKTLTINPQLLPKNTSNPVNGFIVVISIFIGVIVIFLNRFYQKLTNGVLNSVVNYQLGLRIHREKNVGLRRSYAILNVISLLIFSLFIWYVSLKLNIRLAIDQPIRLYFIILIIFMLILLARFLVLILMGKLFYAEEIMSVFLHQNYNLFKANALISLPIIIISYFSGTWISIFFFYLAIFISVAMIFFRYIKAIQLLFHFRILNYYSILYFCTLEILPVLIGAKIVATLI